MGKFIKFKVYQLKPQELLKKIISVLSILLLAQTSVAYAQNNHNECAKNNKINANNNRYLASKHRRSTRKPLIWHMACPRPTIMDWQYLSYDRQCFPCVTVYSPNSVKKKFYKTRLTQGSWHNKYYYWELELQRELELQHGWYGVEYCNRSDQDCKKILVEYVKKLPVNVVRDKDKNGFHTFSFPLDTSVRGYRYKINDGAWKITQRKRSLWDFTTPPTKNMTKTKVINTKIPFNNKKVEIKVEFLYFNEDPKKWSQDTSTTSIDASEGKKQDDSKKTDDEKKPVKSVCNKISDDLFVLGKIEDSNTKKPVSEAKIVALISGTAIYEYEAMLDAAIYSQAESDIDGHYKLPKSFWNGVGGGDKHSIFIDAPGYQRKKIKDRLIESKCSSKFILNVLLQPK